MDSGEREKYIIIIERRWCHAPVVGYVSVLDIVGRESW